MLISIAEHRYIDPSDVSFVAGIDTVSEETFDSYLGKLKKAGALLDITNKQKPRSIIILKQGCALLTSMKAETCMKKIQTESVCL